MRKLYEVKKDYESGELSLVAHELLKVERDWYTIGPSGLSLSRNKHVGLGTTRSAAIESYRAHHLKEIARCEGWIAEHRAALARVESLEPSGDTAWLSKGAAR